MPHILGVAKDPVAEAWHQATEAAQQGHIGQAQPLGQILGGKPAIIVGLLATGTAFGCDSSQIWGSLCQFSLRGTVGPKGSHLYPLVQA